MVKMNYSHVRLENINPKDIEYKTLTRYPYILGVVADFQIVINGDLYFDEPEFPILEFLEQAVCWANSSISDKPLVYNSVETDDNPLITVNEYNGKWYLYSPWGKNECCLEVNREELKDCILELRDSISVEIEYIQEK